MEQLRKFFRIAAYVCAWGAGISFLTSVGAPLALDWTHRFASAKGLSAACTGAFCCLNCQAEVLHFLAWYLCSLFLFLLIWCKFFAALLHWTENVFKHSGNNGRDVFDQKNFCLKVGQHEGD